MRFAVRESPVWSAFSGMGIRNPWTAADAAGNVTHGRHVHGGVDDSSRCAWRVMRLDGTCMGIAPTRSAPSGLACLCINIAGNDHVKDHGNMSGMHIKRQ
jgi:hypothetical protein